MARDKYTFSERMCSFPPLPTFSVWLLPGNGAGVLTYKYTALPPGNSSAKCFPCTTTDGAEFRGYLTSFSLELSMVSPDSVPPDRSGAGPVDDPQVLFQGRREQLLKEAVLVPVRGVEGHQQRVELVPPDPLEQDLRAVVAGERHVDSKM